MNSLSEVLERQFLQYAFNKEFLVAILSSPYRLYRHCHPDKVLERTGMNSLSEVSERHPPFLQSAFNIEFLVANYCFKS